MTVQEALGPCIGLLACDLCGKVHLSFFNEGIPELPVPGSECPKCGTMQAMMMGPALFTMN